MRERMDQILKQYGQSAVLTRRAGGGSVELRAFIQPVLRRQKEAPVAATPLGAVSEERWLYLGGAETQPEPGDRVDCCGLALVCQEARGVYVGDECVYCWAMLRNRKEAAE